MQVDTDNSALKGAVAHLRDAVDLNALIATFRRNLRLFVIVALVVMAAVAVPTMTATPIYTASADVMLDQRKLQASPVQDVLSGLPADAAAVDTQVEVLRSRSLAQRVVKKLNLDKDPEFNPALRKSGGLPSLFGGNTTAATTLSEREKQLRAERVVDRVIGRLSVSRTGTTFLIRISYKHKDAARAAQIANTFAELYLLEQLEAKFEATRQANSWLSERLDELRTRVLAAEAAVQQYKIANNLLSADGATLTEQEISNLNQQLALVKVQQAESEARLSTARQQLSRGSTGDDVGEALGSQVIQQLRSQRAEVSRRVADLEGRYGPLHPEIVNAKRQLTDYDNQIQSEIRRIISNLEAQAQVQRQRTGSLASSVGQARGTLIGNNRALVRLNELERDAEAERALYESFLNRFKQTNAQEGIEQSDARIVSRAKIPTAPSEPKVAIFLAIALFAGVGVATTTIVVRHMMDTGVSTSEDITLHFNKPSLASIPLHATVLDKSSGHLSPITAVVEKPLSGFSEALRNLYTSLVFSRIGEVVKVIAVTSTLPSEGKSTTSICLARTQALSGQSVVLVDCDLRRCSVAERLGVTVEQGLLEVLSGSISLEEALMTDPATGARLLLVKSREHTPSNVFSSVAFDRLLEQLRQQFDLVILDTAPVLPVAETRVLAAKADVVAMLTRWRKTPRKATQSAILMLESAGANVAGVALSMVDMREQAKTGYGDQSYYYGQYNQYYNG